MTIWIKRALGLLVLAFCAALEPLLIAQAPSFHLYLFYVALIAGSVLLARIAIDPNSLLEEVTQEPTPTESFVRQPHDGYLYIDSEGQLV